ncbi:AAA domain protein (macronuclear) [Tetrahymena thermophila SB210]|uniref:AAA domain protein n=1 Tax=Tetrahymena thermophila (strain SB210) TaxID=312017 RepID=Q235B0_TETTS|nr:AAA domain protein [Tetrahymena thermophila SB210]EAR91843.2 AAA domain protein [Tetrahymena thermophila SB210]|eukprot:XP_001012088.2 AAA domain protein [Tetrahymena thermophila SB210]
MPQKNNSISIINSRSFSQSSQSENDNYQNSSFDDDEIQNNSMNSEEEQSSIDSDSVREFQIKNYIDFPDMNLFQNPYAQVLSIPEDYLFNDLQTYQKTMNTLEQERFFKKLRHSLRQNVFKLENGLKNERQESTYEDFQWIQEYQVSNVQFNQSGLILTVKTSMKIQKYQQKQKQWEILNNQIMIFVNKKSKKYFVGKTVDQNKKQQSQSKLDKSSLQNESFNLLIENILQEDIYKDIKKEDVKEVEDILKENYDDFDITTYNQTFQIKMNVLSDIEEFLVNISNINKNYILLTPHEYWYSLQQTLNCSQKFAQLQQIQFYDQTVKGEKGESKFPEYSFLNGRDDLKESFIQSIEEVIQKQVNLDSYQLKALRYALFNQNAVIQGPPGTGKTFLASHLIHTLQNLKNNYCKKPILIISKKNISLDSLLKNLEKINPEIKLLRLGYQTAFEEMKKYTIEKQGGPQRKQIYSLGFQQIDKKLQDYLERDQNQDYYSVNNSQLEESLDNLSFQNFIKEQEIENFLQEMRNYEQSNLKNYEIHEKKYQLRLSDFIKQEQFQFIGMTFTGYHTYYQALQILKPEIIVVEEASEINESEFFPILTPNIKHLIQFGDHQQLKPLIRAKSLIREFNYGMSYFERLIKVNKIDFVTLYQQKRMRPELANFTRLFYGNEYKDDRVVNNRSCVRELSTVGMYLLPHTYPEQKMSEGSYLNEFEVYYIKFLAKRLSDKYKQKNITILSMYKSQKTLIQCKLKKLPEIEVYTVDEFQGNENDIIILSCVRSNQKNKCGYITELQRINVAFSRAKIGFFCIGNFEMYSQKCQKWKEIVQLSLNQFSYGGISQMPLYKKINQLTQFQLEINLYRKGQYQQNICNLCYQKSHIGLCNQGYTFFDYISKFLEQQFQYFQQDKILIDDDQQERQINQFQNLNISQISNNQAANSESYSEFPQLLENIEEKIDNKNINQNKIQNRKKERSFLTEDEKQNSFQSTKKQKQRLSQQKQKKQQLSLTQNLSINFSNSQ